jgi:hypothetical protein
VSETHVPANGRGRAAPGRPRDNPHFGLAPTARNFSNGPALAKLDVMVSTRMHEADHSIWDNAQNAPHRRVRGTSTLARGIHHRCCRDYDSFARAGNLMRIKNVLMNQLSSKT